MLSIKPITSAKSACDYYLQTLNYYKSDATAITWLGSGVRRLSLSKSVNETDFLNLLKGLLPNGQKLQNPKGEHRPGFDMTFSAPKSVSILAGLGITDLIKMHDAAVQDAILKIEKEFAEVRVRQKERVDFIRTNNLVIASFRQPSSRANDPALHTHCVTMNMSFLGDRARSLASDSLRKHGVVEQIQNNAHYCGLLYRQHLANSLKDAGFKLRLTGDGLFEIAGVPDVVLKEFSKRRGDIEKLMQDRGWSGAKSAAIATILTRDGKEEHNLETLEKNWQKRAAELGFNAKEFLKNPANFYEAHSMFAKIQQKLSALFKTKATKDLKANACVSIAIEALSQKESVFSKRDLITQSIKHSLMCDESIDYKDILAAIDLQKNNLHAANIDGQVLLTTPWLLALEVETIARIENNKNCVQKIATQKEVTAYQKTLKYKLTSSQTEAMRTILTTKDRFLAVQGYAGVAKTTMLKETSALIRDKGYILRGLAVSSSAVNELQTKGNIKSAVFPIIYQELQDAKTGSLEKTIYIVDESSMLSSQQGHALIKNIERTHARLILIGDRAQLPSVNNGRIFGLIQDYGISTTTMHEIVRQRNQKLKEAVILTTQGNIKDAAQKLDIKELATHDERISTIAKMWLEKSPSARDKTLLFAATNKDRLSITNLIRNGLKQEGSFGTEIYTQATLIAKPFAAIHQRFTSFYQKDDVIRFNQSYKSHSIQYGGYYTVCKIKPNHLQNNLLPIVDDKGKEILFPLKLLPRYKTHNAAFERIIEVYKKHAIEIQLGDKLMLLRNSKRLGIQNGDIFDLQEISKDALTFKKKSGAILTIDKNNQALKHLDYGYVLTNYKAQGRDADFAIGLMESYNKFGSTLKNFYVQISRAIYDMTLVTDNKERLIEAVINNNDEKKAALDILIKQDMPKQTMDLKIQPSKELAR